MLISAAQAHIAVVYFMIVAVSLYWASIRLGSRLKSVIASVWATLLGFFVTQRNFASA
jgi:hypothetical protein